MKQSTIGVVAIVALFGVLILGVFMATSFERTNDLRQTVADMTDLSDEVDDLQADVAQQAVTLRTLEARPAVNLRELATQFVGLQNQIDDFTDRLDDVAFRLDDVEFKIDRPIGCGSYDPVYWAATFQGGFTC